MTILFARSPPLSPPNSVFSLVQVPHCNPERSHWMGMPRITNGGPEQARKRSFGERERDRANTEFQLLQQ